MTAMLPNDSDHPLPTIEYGAADGWNPPRFEEEPTLFMDRDEITDPLEVASDTLVPQTPGPQSDFFMQTYDNLDQESVTPGENVYRDDKGLYTASRNDMTLRNRVIRLAHNNPQLRPALLPILKQALTGAPSLSRDELSYFSGVSGGAGQKILTAWRKGEVPGWGHFQKLMERLRKIKGLKENPSWGSDKKSLDDLNGLVVKMERYESEVFPHGKPRRQKKQTRMDVFIEYTGNMVGRKAVELAKKIARELDDVGAAGALLEYVAEDINFRGASHAVSRVVPSTPSTSETPPYEVSQALDYGIESFAVFAVSLLNFMGKKAMAKKLMKALLEEEDILFEVI